MIVPRLPVAGLVATLLAVPGEAPAQRAPRVQGAGPVESRAAASPDHEQVFRQLRLQLHALLEAQDAVRSQRGRFATGFGTGAEAVPFVPPPGVVVRLGHADARGWAAIATHAALPGRSCVIWAGQVPIPRRPETSHDGNQGGEGEVVCDLVP